MGDLSHKNRKSDHNPNAAGVVCAIDIDEDLAPDIHSIKAVVDAICASRDKRVKYIIYEGKITVEGSNLQRWKTYSGVNPHDHHAHISVVSDPTLYDDERDWHISAAVPAGGNPGSLTEKADGESGPTLAADTTISAAKPPIHVVKKGDTLSGLSIEYGLSVAEIKKLNGLKSDLIKVGQKLKIR
ncbi:MAG: LysM peptidoglycan-binding domain-containing protein [Chloracidobacterium sp.]|nr:LysM peptidoglycan-binding domain-containing protein [Chloracidobacterium sp.]